MPYILLYMLHECVDAEKYRRPVCGFFCVRVRVFVCGLYQWNAVLRIPTHSSPTQLELSASMHIH